MPPKKICVLNPYIPTLGGGEKHMGHLIQFMEDYYKDVQIDILVHNYNEIDVHAKDYVTIDDLNAKFDLKLRHTNIVKLDLDFSGSLSSRIGNRKLIEDKTRDYDIFVNMMFLSKHVGRAQFNIYECMFPPRRYASEAQPGIRMLMAKWMDRRFYESYNCFIAISKFTNHWLATFWQESDKNIVKYPPVFWEKEMEGRYHEEKKKNIIISVGRFFVASHSKKQLEMTQFFVNHQDVFKDYEYHLVGSVSNSPKDIEYLNQIKALAATVKNVVIHEDCPSAELMELYTQAKIFWHATGYMVDENRDPDKMEHFGITTVEAMSFGAVPVVINKGGQKETVIPGENGYLWNTEEECVENTVRLIRDDALRRRLAEASVKRAKNFSIDEFYRQNRRIFNAYNL